MPMYHAGKGKWKRRCDRCNKPFVRTTRYQKSCDRCKEISFREKIRKRTKLVWERKRQRLLDKLEKLDKMIKKYS